MTALACPFCTSTDLELVSPWGGQLITSQLRCLKCNTYFEAVRETFEATPKSDQAQCTTSSDAAP
jgi:C4-type Zn-finger protein